ncbi:C-type lectin domain family 7 member a [Plakobranchus ocellatus]|uniref:C-type lectin domain family 7 member a n=1 Tax=Plakobranchus ocellatus TaxID=259542 RepID=A0AAV3YTS6_9GAST|nr:C-type lectin domain family 7 member a [Plakobranchus ocellatus]
MTNAIIFHAFEVVLLLLTLREIKGAEYIGCPPGWIHFTDTCYLIRGGHDSWDTADLQCKNYGAELAVLRYVEQQDFINSQLHLKCVDRDESCPQRANNGDCLKLGQLMKSSCPFSCGLCSSLCENAYDQPGICASRAAEGYCDIYPVIMMKDCMKSCGCNGYSDEYWVSESLAVYQWYEPRYIKKCVILRIQNGILYEAPCTGVAGYICEMKEQVLQLPAVDSSRTGCPVVNVTFLE